MHSDQHKGEMSLIPQGKVNRKTEAYLFSANFALTVILSTIHR